ncbi:thiamine pyrophosphate-dependent enzyme [Pseudarthrobacter sp. MDT3-26]|uniref:thiamine pyrophosphate-dependent enzyme n=1 Tax=Pseudarthrobacter raffinosi TaxID=2953651 RepID=UPI00208E929C|nr:thiamine pyrophosphate-dependent enzyme [Pseudarthrobacter sp. MDT3-26]MCO4262515.1 thiamine pyrophosphate-dependent enzyme [Pseudarthrobacter sp. MDT3-26]
MPLTSRIAVSIIAEYRSPDAISVSTMTGMKFFHAASPSPLNVSSVPMMGGASALGLGLALAQPARTVLVLDGDGSLLMQLGSLATVVGARPQNYVHFVFDNGVWFEGGGNLPVPSAGTTDFAGLAEAAGYAATYTIGDEGHLREALPRILAGPSPAFVHLQIEPDRSAPWTVDNPPAAFPDNQYVRMGQEARLLQAALTEAAGTARGPSF